MTPADLALRRTTYRLFVRLGRAPAATEVAVELSDDVPQVLAGWRRLHDAHALVLDPTGSALLMANPFSAVPTPYVVRAIGRDWYANCAWDAFGICAALHSDGRVRSRCPDCSNQLEVGVVDGRPDESTLLFHCLVPAARWWDDIVFT